MKLRQNILESNLCQKTLSSAKPSKHLESTFADHILIQPTTFCFSKTQGKFFSELDKKKDSVWKEKFAQHSLLDTLKAVFIASNKTFHRHFGNYLIPILRYLKNCIRLGKIVLSINFSHRAVKFCFDHPAKKYSSQGLTYFRQSPEKTGRHFSDKDLECSVYNKELLLWTKSKNFCSKFEKISDPKKHSLNPILN